MLNTSGYRNFRQNAAAEGLDNIFGVVSQTREYCPAFSCRPYIRICAKGGWQNQTHLLLTGITEYFVNIFIKMADTLS